VAYRTVLIATTLKGGTRGFSGAGRISRGHPRPIRRDGVSASPNIWDLLHARTW